MKTGDLVELTDDEGEGVLGTVVQIVIQIEDDDGELWEIPVEEAIVPDLEPVRVEETD